jgi:deoxyhypusine synthase
MKSEIGIETNKAMGATRTPVTTFMRHHFRHFNAAALIDAADAYKAHLSGGGKMMVTLAGAMSTAELGLSLAEMIRQGKVHCISCTGANLEEDLYNLIAHDFYERIPHYRDLTPHDEKKLLERHLNRVTDTCIPEEEAMRRLERAVLEEWQRADKNGERFFPHEFLFKVLRSGVLKKNYQIDPKDSWMIAAAEKNLPMVVPGWEDSTLGNMFAASCIRNDVKSSTMRSGIEYMIELAAWYQATAPNSRIGFFPNRWWHCGRLPHLCRSHDPPGPAPRNSGLGLFLPDQRFDHQLRLLFRRRAQRKNHVGQAGSRHAAFRDRVRRDHCGALDVRNHSRLVTAAFAPTALLIYAQSTHARSEKPTARLRFPSG